MTKRLISCLLCLCTLIGFAAVAYADDPVEVVFWNGYTGSDQPTLEAIVETYNNSQDKVHIKMEIMPWDTLYQKLMPAFIAGNAPDLIGFLRHEVHGVRDGGQAGAAGCVHCFLRNDYDG